MTHWSDEPTLNNAIWEHRRLIDAHVHRLHLLASALDAVGNSQLADSITEDLEHLIVSSKLISERYSEDLNNQIKHGEHMVGGLLSLAIHKAVGPSDSHDKPASHTQDPPEPNS